MSNKSLEDALNLVIERVNNTNKSSIFRDNEAAVTTGLVFPVLYAIGWNIFNPIDEVIPEYPIHSGARVDIALLNKLKPVCFLEIKNLSENLTNIKNLQRALDQLNGYCTFKGVKLGILTNGKIWIFLENISSKPAIERILLHIDLTIINDLSYIKEKILNIFSFLEKDNIKNFIELYKAEREQICKNLLVDLINNKINKEKFKKLLNIFKCKEVLEPLLEEISGSSYRDEKHFRCKSTNFIQKSTNFNFYITFEESDKIHTFKAENLQNLLQQIITWAIKNQKLTRLDFPIKSLRGNIYFSLENNKWSTNNNIHSISTPIGKVYYEWPTGGGKYLRLKRLLDILEEKGIKVKDHNISYLNNEQ